MNFVWYVMIIYIFLCIISMINVFFYKRSRIVQAKRRLVLIRNWKNYFDSVIYGESSKAIFIENKYLKKLYSQEELMSFYDASTGYLNSENFEIKSKFQNFIRDNKEVWVKLGHSYKKHEYMKKAYLAFLLESTSINESKDYDDITKLMLNYVIEPSVYCRENALNALYIFGNKHAVIDAFKRLSDNNIMHNDKLITDGLLKFKGNSDELVIELFKHLDEFKTEYQVAFVDYFRFKGEKLKYKLKDYLENKDTHKELVCALIRYYRKYVVMEYKDIILSWLNDSNIENWECISTAASALENYPGEDTISSLKLALSSKNWYVRKNAARSIVKLDVEEEMLEDILNGHDLYAKEQLIYQQKYFMGGNI